MMFSALTDCLRPRLFQRWREQQATASPQIVETAWQRDRRGHSEVALEDFAVVADVVDDVPGPRVVESERGAIARLHAEQARDVGIVSRRHLWKIRRRDAECLRLDHCEDCPAQGVEQVDVLLTYELRQRFARNPI